MRNAQVQRDLAGIGASARGRARCTARLEHMELATESALRVVASFNREPSPEECASVLGGMFEGRMSIVPGSFRRVDARNGSRVVLAGFMGEAAQEADVAELEAETSRFKEVASGSNVYVMKEDNSLWRVDPDNDRLVRTATEDLSEIMEAASTHVKPGITGRPVVALATVSDGIDGPSNTQYVAYVNPNVDEAKVSFGARIDADHVLDRATGQVVEIARNMVIECRSMRGRDMMLATDEGEQAMPAIDSRDDMVEYYRKVYGYNPAWLDQFENIINQGAWA